MLELQNCKKVMVVLSLHTEYKSSLKAVEKSELHEITEANNGIIRVIKL